MTRIAPYLVVTKDFVRAVNILTCRMEEMLRAHDTRKSLRPFKPDKQMLQRAESEVGTGASNMRKMRLSADERRVVLTHLREVRKRFEPLRKRVAKVHDLTYAWVLNENFLPNLIRAIKRA